MSRSIVIGLLLGVAGLGPVGAQEYAVPEAEIVATSFGWEAGTAFEATSTKTRVRRGPGVAPVESSVSSTYGITVEEAGESLRVKWVNPSVDTVNVPPEMTPSAREQLVERVSALMPDFLVSRDGAYGGLVDFERHRSEMRQLFLDVFPDETEAQAMPAIDRMILTEAFFDTRLAQEWNAIVGTWIDGEFEIGAEYEMSQEEPIPLVPGEKVLMNYVFSAARTLSCERGGVTRKCVELTMRSSADPGDMKRLTARLFEQLDAAAPEELSQLQGFDNRTTLRVVTEADGLFPHEFDLERTVGGTTLVDGARQEFSQIDSRAVRYTHD